MTIIEERLPYVDFTVPYAESGLSMIVPMKSGESAWMFMKPFTWELWLVTGAILIYTMFVVWYLERERNPEFQLSTALWFTFSSLFFAHSEYQIFLSVGIKLGTPRFTTLTHTSHQPLALDPNGPYQFPYNFDAK